MIGVRFWTFIAENILKVISAKRAAIFPFRIAGAIAFPNGNPAVPADRLSLPGEGLLEPRNNKPCFWFELAIAAHIVGRQRAVKRILAGYESHWNIAASCGR